jgi:hypothetical protein
MTINEILTFERLQKTRFSLEFVGAFFKLKVFEWGFLLKDASIFTGIIVIAVVNGSNFQKFIGIVIRVEILIGKKSQMIS